MAGSKKLWEFTWDKEVSLTLKTASLNLHSHYYMRRASLFFFTRSLKLTHNFIWMTRAVYMRRHLAKEATWHPCFWFFKSCVQVPELGKLNGSVVDRATHARLLLNLRPHSLGRASQQHWIKWHGRVFSIDKDVVIISAIFLQKKLNAFCETPNRLTALWTRLCGRE